jgi:beta-galactosidase
MEKRQGKYDFELFRRAVDMFAEKQIDVLMCTPTAAPPAWLTHKHPETLVSDTLGHRALHGIRQQCCYNSKTFRKFSRRITDKLTKGLADCGNIVAWQIDNELGQRLQGACSCDTCQEGFRKYLKERYQTLDNLNHCWKNAFWSQDYSDWDEVLLAFPECLWNKSPQVISANYSVSRVLDSLRFYDKIIKEYMMQQVEIIRRNIPQSKITTNNPVGILDLKSVYKDLDFTAGDFYWENRKTSAMAERLTRYRSYRGEKFFIAETGLGYDYLALPTGQQAAKLDMWRSFAYGAISYLVFRWRPPLGGQEQTALCPLSPAGKPRKTYRVAKEMFGQVNMLKGKLENLKLPKAEVAILFDSDVEKSYLRHGYGSSIKYDEVIANVFEQMHKRNIPAVFVSPESSIDEYKLLVLPSQRIARRGVSQKIREFIHAGGNVWAIGELNTADENGNFILNDCPEHLGEAFGITLHTGAGIPSKNGTVKLHVAGSINGKALDLSFNGCWIADVERQGSAESLLKFTSGYYQGQDAVIHNQHGKGHVYYQGISNPGPEIFSELAEAVIENAGIARFPDCPGGIEIIDCEEAVFIINSNNSKASFKFPIAGEALLGCFDVKTGLVELEALDLCIIKRLQLKIEEA